MPGSRTKQLLQCMVFCAAYALCATLVTSPVFAQPPANNPDEMCGDGTTFTVQLTGSNLGIDDSHGLFQVIERAPSNSQDSVTLPKGCRIYAIFISGYGNNWNYTDIPFFKVAEFVAKHNGYVHVGWWNNFTKEYAARPLFPFDVVIRLPLGFEERILPSPAKPDDLGIIDWTAFAPALATLDRPKANPDEDVQFQLDAGKVIQAIRANNPDAIIMVAGHSMGGNAVARLGFNPDLPIDLLAPIDPVGNRDQPRGIPGLSSFNWTRWRVANEFRGYKQWDCVRNSLGLCQDFDSRLFYVSFHCVPVGEYRPAPLIPTRSIACPFALPYSDPGTRNTIGPNIKHLYHRWQHEALWPVDFLAT